MPARPDYTPQHRLKSLPYASKWKYWATALYIYKTLKPTDYRPNIRARIYTLSSDQQSWSACKEAYRDYAPPAYGGRDEYIPTVHAADDPELDLDVNLLEWRYYRSTCSTLLLSGADIQSLDWAALVQPCIHLRIVYDAETKSRAERLAGVIYNLGFASIHASTIPELKALI